MCQLLFSVAASAKHARQAAGSSAWRWVAQCWRLSLLVAAMSDLTTAAAWACLHRCGAQPARSAALPGCSATRKGTFKITCTSIQPASAPRSIIQWAAGRGPAVHSQCHPLVDLSIAAHVQISCDICILGSCIQQPRPGEHLTMEAAQALQRQLQAEVEAFRQIQLGMHDRDCAQSRASNSAGSRKTNTRPCLPSLALQMCNKITACGSNRCSSSTKTRWCCRWAGTGGSGKGTRAAGSASAGLLLLAGQSCSACCVQLPSLVAGSKFTGCQPYRWDARCLPLTQPPLSLRLSWGFRSSSCWARVPTCTK